MKQLISFFAILSCSLFLNPPPLSEARITEAYKLLPQEVVGLEHVSFSADEKLVMLRYGNKIEIFDVETGETKTSRPISGSEIWSMSALEGGGK